MFNKRVIKLKTLYGRRIGDAGVIPCKGGILSERATGLAFACTPFWNLTAAATKILDNDWIKIFLGQDTIYYPLTLEKIL